jgi:AraC-like DNA-binding protein
MERKWGKFDDIQEYPNQYNHIPGFEFISIGNRLKEMPELFKAPLLTTDYRIIIPNSHVDNHLLDFSKTPFHPNSIFFTGKNKVHLFDPNGNYDGIAIGFTENFICRNEEDLMLLMQEPLFNNPGWESISPENMQAFMSIVNSIEQELKNQAPDIIQRHLIRNLLHNFILLSVREYKKQHHREVIPGTDARITQQYKVMIASNFKVIRTVAAYAGMLNVTEKRLNQATANILKQTAKEVFDEQLIIEARRLVSFTTMSIKEVGFELGFSQATHFTKFFIKHIGIPPGTFREQHAIQS